MRFNVRKPKPEPALGTSFAKPHFCLLPRRIGDKIAWLEWVKVVWTYKTVTIVGDFYDYDVNRWVPTFHFMF